MPKHIKLPDYAYFITARLAHGLSVFKEEHCCSLLLQDINFYRLEFHYQLYGYVIMPDHLHLIIQPSLMADISTVMNKIKGHSSFTINKHLGRIGKLWQKGYYDHIIRNGKDFEEKINYIHKNPVRAGLSENMQDFKFSSYRNYYLGDKSSIKIDIPIYSM